MTSSAATTIRQRLDALRPQVLAVATRHGASNLRIYGSIATGREHAASDLDLLGCSVDVTEAETLHPLIRTQILEQVLAL
jgi:predicted nucleotidyltransferase